MTLVETIAAWQMEALSIQPPLGSGLLPAVGGLPGPAFFPEGFGLSHPILPEHPAPTIMAVGHNFGCAQYREGIGPAGREDDKATWRNLDACCAMPTVPPRGVFGRTGLLGCFLATSKQASFCVNPIGGTKKPVAISSSSRFNFFAQPRSCYSVPRLLVAPIGSFLPLSHGESPTGGVILTAVPSVTLRATLRFPPQI